MKNKFDSDVFDSAEFEKRYHNDKPLGAFCSETGTLFRSWAPTADSVTLRLYSSGNGDTLLSLEPMEYEGNGAWTAELPTDLHGIYYDYAVKVDGTELETSDPYARACGLNGERSMVTDLSKTDPPNWNEDAPPSLPEETVIYEIHVKDISFDPASGVEPALRGKFKALCLEDTTLNGDGLHPTCLGYMKKLGVTYIQIMPPCDYGTVDESGPATQYNWGYDPVNYNLPEGSYSTDPYHGEVRIREMKEMVQALHHNGFRVIIDVVYNHTYRLDSCLWRTVPWYFYRRYPDGAVSNGSGCGNDLANERSMCARYILDSVLYWAEEYHIDGFRFDLMGLLDVGLLNRIQSVLDERFGKNEKLIFGEPWSASESAARKGTKLAQKENLRRLNNRIGAFCDATRDLVKGGLSAAEQRGFVNGGGMTAELLEPCLKGWAGEYGRFSVQAPSQTITYLSAHDDWTLWDKLVYTLDKAKDFDHSSENVIRANRLAAAINFCCQGHLFLLAGEEYGRTKCGVRNSYNSAPELRACPHKLKVV